MDTPGASVSLQVLLVVLVVVPVRVGLPTQELPVKVTEVVQQLVRLLLPVVAAVVLAQSVAT